MGFKKIGVYFLCFTGVLLAYTPPSGAVSKLNSYRGYSDLTKAAGSMDIDLELQFEWLKCKFEVLGRYG